MTQLTRVLRELESRATREKRYPKVRSKLLLAACDEIEMLREALDGVVGGYKMPLFQEGCVVEEKIYVTPETEKARATYLQAEEVERKALEGIRV